MSLAFELRVDPPARLGKAIVALYLVAAFSVAAASLLLWSTFRSPGAVLAAGQLLATLAILAALAVALRRARRARRAGARGVLRVRADGAAGWSGAGDSSETSASAVRWLSLAGVCWIEATVGSRRVVIVSGRDRCEDQVWARLNRWLRWMERGYEP